MKNIIYLLLISCLSTHMEISKALENTTPNKIDLGIKTSLDSNNIFGGFIGYKKHFSNNFLLGFESSIFVKHSSNKLNTNVATKIGYSLDNRLIPYVIIGIGNEFFKSEKCLSNEKYAKINSKLAKSSDLIRKYNLALAAKTTLEI